MLSMTKQHLILSCNFERIDQVIIHQGIIPLSLNPNKNIITSFRDIGHIITEKTDNIQLIRCIASSLETILKAQIDNFPENLFWDFDLIVFSLLEQSLSAKEGGIRFLESFTNKLVELMKMFGCKSEIRFRYVHDFTYGFDWARWVKKDPVNRANIHPFSPFFLDYLLSKGKELLQRISMDDAHYHHISTCSYRNPFRFSRDPKDEYRLLTYLAGYDLIPVSTWNRNTNVMWDKPFDQLREQVSLKLCDGKNGIARK
jgi:hypothetical protein